MGLKKIPRSQYKPCKGNSITKIFNEFYCVRFRDKCILKKNKTCQQTEEKVEWVLTWTLDETELQHRMDDHETQSPVETKKQILQRQTKYDN